MICAYWGHTKDMHSYMFCLGGEAWEIKHPGGQAFPGGPSLPRSMHKVVCGCRLFQAKKEEATR